LGNTSSPYQYSINSGAFGLNNTFSNLAIGTYSIKVKDAGGCVISQAVQIVRGNTGISFAGVIKPIIDSKCATNSNCHATGASGHPELTSYDLIKANASKVKSLTSNKTMPKEGSLTDNQIKQIACWVEDGAPNN
jgi:hypothetical protein